MCGVLINESNNDIYNTKMSLKGGLMSEGLMNGLKICYINYKKGS